VPIFFNLGSRQAITISEIWNLCQDCMWSEQSQITQNVHSRVKKTRDIFIGIDIAAENAVKSRCLCCRHKRVLLAETQLPGTGNHTSVCWEDGISQEPASLITRETGGGSMGMNVNEEVGNKRDRLKKKMGMEW